MNEKTDVLGGEPWRKSSYSSGAGGECLEVAALPHGIHVRDSKDTARPAIPVTAPAWAAFIGFAGR
ncbi:DUF397 domain-containing protein [Streptomyces sp. NPDC090306]|uniref:DUF397 domain-containing protein n=1 Tax=unclassified Streptomyces TaxID=2593676 RepID=UPI0036E4B893